MERPLLLSAPHWQSLIPGLRPTQPWCDFVPSLPTDTKRQMMSKGQFGARDLHKHLWKLSIPEFDPAQELHASIAEAGETAAGGAGKKLAELREKRTDKLTGTIVRRELRTWLRTAAAGEAVETAVGRLLAGGQERLRERGGRAKCYRARR